MVNASQASARGSSSLATISRARTRGEGRLDVCSCRTCIEGSLPVLRDKHGGGEMRGGSRRKGESRARPTEISIVVLNLAAGLSLFFLPNLLPARSRLLSGKQLVFTAQEDPTMLPALGPLPRRRDVTPQPRPFPLPLYSQGSEPKELAWQSPSVPNLPREASR